MQKNYFLFYKKLLYVENPHKTVVFEFHLSTDLWKTIDILRLIWPHKPFFCLNADFFRTSFIAETVKNSNLDHFSSESFSILSKKELKKMKMSLKKSCSGLKKIGIGRNKIKNFLKPSNKF